jgi:hypothetical protein
MSWQNRVSRLRYILVLLRAAFKMKEITSRLKGDSYFLKELTKNITPSCEWQGQTLQNLHFKGFFVHFIDYPPFHIRLQGFLN